MFVSLQRLHILQASLGDLIARGGPVPVSEIQRIYDDSIAHQAPIALTQVRASQPRLH